MNFAKFLGARFFKEHIQWLLLNLEVFCKKVFWTISLNSQVNICDGVLFLRLKETQSHVFFLKFCENLKKVYSRLSVHIYQTLILQEANLRESIYKSSRPEVVCKIGLLRNFAKFTGKHLYQRLLLIKLPKAWNNIKKDTMAQEFSCEFCEISKNSFSYRTPPVVFQNRALQFIIPVVSETATWDVLGQLPPMKVAPQPQN